MTERLYRVAADALGEMMRLAQDEEDEREIRRLAEELEARALCAGFRDRLREERKAA